MKDNDIVYVVLFMEKDSDGVTRGSICKVCKKQLSAYTYSDGENLKLDEDSPNYYRVEAWIVFDH